MDKSSIFFIEKRNDEYIDIPQFPKELFVDTSFIFQLHGNDENLSQQKKSCRAFYEDCLLKKTELFVTNDIYSEVEHVIQRNVVKKLYEDIFHKGKYPEGMGEKQVYDLVDSRINDLAGRIEEEVYSIHSFMDKSMMTLEYKNDEIFRQDIKKVRKATEYKVNVNDVKHIVVAHMYDINSIATMDADFNRFNNLNIFTVKSDKMKNDKIGRANVYLPFKDNDI